jgi:hypothetical protein
MDKVEYSTLSPEQKLEADTKIAEAEWVRFTSKPVISNPEELSDFDMLRHWQVSGINISTTVYLICSQNAKKNLPLLYAIAMDVLPMQASSVPCERVFSSSKETDTMRRSQLSPETMEMFQVLKFQYRSRRLDFNNKWIASEAKLSVADISLELVDKMLADGRVSELFDLLTNNDSSSNLLTSI